MRCACLLILRPDRRLAVACYDHCTMSAAVALVYKAEIMPGDHCAELLSYFIVCPLVALFAFYNPKARRNEGKGFSSFLVAMKQYWLAA